MSISLEFMTEQANEFGTHWRTEVVDDSIHADSGGVHFSATVGVTGVITWVFVSESDKPVEVIGYWNPLDLGFVASGAILEGGNDDNEPKLFSIAGMAGTLWLVVDQLAERMPVKTSKGMKA